MAPLIINVTGTSTVQRRAERAVLHIYVTSTDLIQSKVAEDVRVTCQTLQEIFTSLSPKTETGHFTPAAAITVWTMGSIKSSSQIPYQLDEDTPEKQREYTASSSFHVTFKNFSILRDVSAQLLDIPFVEVGNIWWQLTESTKRVLEVESRKAAMSDAVCQANDLAEVLGREVQCVEVKDAGSRVDSSRGAPSPELDNSSARRGTRRGTEKVELNVEPETLQFDAEVRAKFATGDFSVSLKLGDSSPY